jgi:hypothetical protein
MVRISPQEQLIRLLSAKLKSQGTLRIQQPNSERGLRPLRRARALLETQGLSEQEAGHLLLAGILADHFGPRVASDPQFQSIIDKIYEQIKDDKDAHELLQATLNELREIN